MSYVRISPMTPAQGREEEVRRLNQDLSTFYRAEEGGRDPVVISAADGSGELGRLSVCDSEEAAERAANHQRSMSLRPQLRLATQPGHAERSFFAP